MDLKLCYQNVCNYLETFDTDTPVGLSSLKLKKTPKPSVQQVKKPAPQRNQPINAARNNVVNIQQNKPQNKQINQSQNIFSSQKFIPNNNSSVLNTFVF